MVCLKGDDKKRERKIKAIKDAKNSWNTSGWGKWSTDYINEYTITMDIKMVDDETPANGLSLYQTALMHSEEDNTGKKPLQSSEGETIVNSQGQLQHLFA